MNIGLLDIDGHNFPNLALMKISAWHKSQEDNVEFATMFGKYDIIYKSKVFSWTVDPDYIFNTKKTIKGGTGYDYSIKLSGDIEHLPPDYSLYNCEHAYGFLTRGCIRRCDWCLVPEKEGNIKAHADIDEFLGKNKTVILMDNNVLASEHGIKQIEKMSKMDIKIDFNQGLDARLIDDSVSKLLSKVKWIRFIRMSCDTIDNLEYIKKAIKLLNNNRIKNYKIFIYMLIKNIDESLEVANYFKEIGVCPFGQPYRDFKNNKPSYEQKKIARWINLKKAFRSMSYEDFKCSNF